MATLHIVSARHHGLPVSKGENLKVLKCQETITAWRFLEKNFLPSCGGSGAPMLGRELPRPAWRQFHQRTPCTGPGARPWFGGPIHLCGCLSYLCAPALVFPPGAGTQPALFTSRTKTASLRARLSRAKPTLRRRRSVPGRFSEAERAIVLRHRTFDKRASLFVLRCT